MTDVTLSPKRHQVIFQRSRALFLRLSGYYVSRGNPEGDLTYLDVSLFDQELIATLLLDTPA